MPLDTHFTIYSNTYFYLFKEQYLFDSQHSSFSKFFYLVNTQTWDIPKTHVEKKQMAIGTENSSTGEVEEGRFLELNGAASLAYIVSSRPLRELASQIQW